MIEGFLLKLLAREAVRRAPRLIDDRFEVRDFARGIRLPGLAGRWRLDLVFRRQQDDSP